MLLELGDRYWALGLPAAAKSALVRALAASGDVTPALRLTDIALAQGDAQARIVKRFARHIEGDVHHRCRLTREDLNLWILRQALGMLARQHADEVHLASAQRRRPRHPVLHNFELDALEVGQARFPVGRVLFQDDEMLRLPPPGMTCSSPSSPVR